MSSDLHGNAPDNSSVVLLLVDVISDLEFSGGEVLAQHALPAAKNIAALKNRAIRAGIPTIYVNDNFGKWRSDFRTLVSHCIDDDTRGRPIAEILKPQPEDYFVLKPKQSGFYSTTLDLLLKHLGAKTLIIAGFTGDICILFTAIDAHIRRVHQCGNRGRNQHMRNQCGEVGNALRVRLQHRHRIGGCGGLEANRDS